MRIKDFLEDKGTSAATLPDHACSTKAAGQVVKGIVDAAIEALWTFFNRPLPDGVHWATFDGSEGLASFARNIASRPEHLFAMCREFHNCDGLTNQEADALREMVEIADVLGFCAAEPSAGSRRKYSIAATWPCEVNDGPKQGQCIVMDGTGRRSEERDTIVLTADFRHDSSQYRVRVRNISPGGAMIDGVAGTASGDRAAVHIRDLGWVNGTIAWSLETRCGIVFDRPVDVKRLA